MSSMGAPTLLKQRVIQIAPYFPTAIFGFMPREGYTPAMRNRTVESTLGPQRNFALAVWAITLLGAVVRLVELGSKSFWLDEIASIAICTRPPGMFFDWVWRHEGNMALYYFLLRPWLHLGASEAWVRLLSAIPGIAAIPVMYLLAKRLFSVETAFLSALLLAVSPCAVVYSQEARAYSLLVLATIVATYLFVRMVEEPSLPIAGAYGAAAAATLYCHYFGILVVAAHLASLLALPLSRIPWKQLLVALAIMAAIAWPVVWMVFTQDAGHLAWVGRPSLLELYHLGVFLAAEGGKAAGPVLLAGELVLIALFLFKAKSLWTQSQRSVDMWKYALAVSGLFTPIFISLAVSIAKPVFFHRFLIICLPAWLLMVAAGLEEISRSSYRRWATIAVCIISLVTVALSYGKVREDWRGATGFIIANVRSDDGLLYYDAVGSFAVDTYREKVLGNQISYGHEVQVFPPDVTWKQQLGEPARVWFVRYPDKLNNDAIRDLEAHLSQSYKPVHTTVFRAITITEYLHR